MEVLHSLLSKKNKEEIEEEYDYDADDCEEEYPEEELCDEYGHIAHEDSPEQFSEYDNEEEWEIIEENEEDILNKETSISHIMIEFKKLDEFVEIIRMLSLRCKCTATLCKEEYGKYYALLKGENPQFINAITCIYMNFAIFIL